MHAGKDVNSLPTTHLPVEPEVHDASNAAVVK
jgi:hypothetical protein